MPLLFNKGGTGAYKPSFEISSLYVSGCAGKMYESSFEIGSLLYPVTKKSELL
jgi:hypothetical protein